MLIKVTIKLFSNVNDTTQMIQKRKKNKGGHSMMNHFVDLIRILSTLSSKNICKLLSPEMLNEFNSFSATLQRESGRNLKIPTSILSRIVEINGIPVASFTDAEKLSRIRDSSSPLLCKIFGKRDRKR